MVDNISSYSLVNSHLFTLRVWVESSNDEKLQVRVQIKHVLSGTTRNFLNWSHMIDFIEDRLNDGKDITQT
jgi:hypothetical protein